LNRCKEKIEEEGVTASVRILANESKIDGKITG
jgi:hypothetical protein